MPSSVLHPALKLEYFQVHKWKTEWIELAEDLVREEFKRYYENKEESIQDEAHKVETEAKVGCRCCALTITDDFPSPALMMSSATSPSAPSMRCLLLHEVNWMTTSSYRLRGSRTRSNGGTISVVSIRTFHEWLSIT